MEGSLRWHKKNLFRTQCTVVCLHECGLPLLPPSIPCLHYSSNSNSRLQHVSKKVCTHSPSMFMWAFLQWWACWEEGNKYIGPVNGDNNKIWLIKLKWTKGLEPAAGEFHRIFKGWLEVKNSNILMRSLPQETTSSPFSAVGAPNWTAISV